MILLILLVVFLLFYYKFIYYRHHESDITPISLVLLGIFLGVFGLLYFFSGTVQEIVIINNVLPVYIVLVGFMIVSDSLIIIGYEENRKRINKHIDVLMTFMKKMGLWKLFPTAFIILIPLSFFIVLGSYMLLGQNYFYVWTIIFIAWVFSNARLVRYIETLRKK